MSWNDSEVMERPKSKETEQDLLEQQERFFRSVQGIGSGGPSRVDKRKVEEGKSEKKVKFKVPDDHDQEKEDDEEERMETDRFDVSRRGTPPINEEEEGILMDIVECNMNNVKVVTPTFNESLSPFPEVLRCNPKAFVKRKEAKTSGSIFARQLQMRRSESDHIQLSKKPQNIRLQLTSRVIDGTGLDRSTGENLAREIHEENVKKLSTMSKEEILREQNVLMTTLKPDLLNFLKKRKQQKEEESGDLKQKNDLSAAEEVVVVSNDETSASVESNRSNVEMMVEELPIPPNEVSKYVNMSKVEVEKLAWTTSLPEPKPLDPKTGYPARFDFEGFLLSRDEDVPVYRALHHHGKEPEVAGYTLEELFIYSRSSVLQQRVLGLTTLAKILAKNGEGCYDECLSAPLVPQLLDSGIVLLLRWALDDNMEGSLAPSVAALHALVVNPADEICLDRTFSWYRGEEMPYLRTTTDDNNDTFDDESSKEAEEKELSDAELIKMDVVKGMIRMDVLQRFRYVLEVLRPSAPVVVHIVEILIRLSRHSLQVADTVARFPRLVPVIVKEFIPTFDSARSLNTKRVRGENEMQLSSYYGIPMYRAVKLIRILASSGRHLASYLQQTHLVMNSVLHYVDVNAHLKTFLGNAEYSQLLVEMYRTWKVFLTYGLTEDYFEYYYALIGQRLHVSEGLSMNTNVESTAFDCNLAAEMITVVTVVISNTTQETAMTRDIVGLQLMIKTCLTKWLWELAHSDEQTYLMLKLVAVTFTALVTVYEASKLQPSFNVVDNIIEIKDLFKSSIVPFMESKVFNNLLSLMSSSSFLLSGVRLGTDRDPSQLPSLGSLTWGGHLSSLCADNSPFVFLGHFLHSLYTLWHIHGGLDDRFHMLLFSNDYFIKYLERIGTEAMSGVGRGRHWFARFEVNVVCDLLILSSPRPQHPRIFHKAAMAVIYWLQNGDEKMASKLFSSVVFNSAFISEVNDIEAALRQLSMNDRNTLETPTFTSADRSQLLQQTLANLPSICTTYTTHVLKSASSSIGCQTRECLLVHYDPVSIVSDDFHYLPIVTLFSKATKVSVQKQTLDLVDTGDADVDDTSRNAIVHCLQWCHLLGCLRGDVFGSAKPEVRFRHFATIFLIDSDLFLDPSVHRYLTDIVHLMSHRRDFSRLRLESHSKSRVLSSFDDFYKQLLNQFEAVSYGDHLFGIFVMTPMQMRYNIQFRKTVWTEHGNALRSLGVTFRELPFPLEEFLKPNEDDIILLGCYLSALINGLVRPNSCPVLYVIAVHHVHNFLFCGGEHSEEAKKGLAADMLRRLRSFETAVFYEHVVHYKGLNTAVSLGFDFDH